MTVTTPLTTHDHDYATLLLQLQAGIEKTLADPGTPLFTTSVGDLFARFLDALPEAERQVHTCTACRRFVAQFGGLVTVDPQGNLVSALWRMDEVPAVYARAVTQLQAAIEGARITGVFYSSTRTWGTPSNVGPTERIWRHLAVLVPHTTVWQKRGTSADQAMAAKTQDFLTLRRALDEFNSDQLEIARMITSEDSDLYRAESVRGIAVWLFDLKQRIAQVRGSHKDHLLWHAVATAPTGFCHPRSSMIGTLLADIGNGLNYDAIQRRFAAKMRPDAYQRAHVAPSVGTIKHAEQLFTTLGLAPSLNRRYAQVDEIPAQGVVWKPTAPKAEPTPRPQSSLFSHITPKHAQESPPLADISRTLVMTWEKFRRTVLPIANHIEVQIPATAERFAALVTAAEPSAPPILKWDTLDARNPFLWYYAAGVDAEMRRRVVAAGGRVENVDIRATLLWNNRNDLDIHCHTPSGDHIYYGNKRERSGHGWLDVDMNVCGETDEPVENIRWERTLAQPGKYTFFVNLYATHYGCAPKTPFRVEIEVEGALFAFESETSYQKRTVEVATFVYERGKPVELVSHLAAQPTAVSPNAWGVVPGTYVPVRAIVTSPNLWATPPHVQHGQHAFFLLEGCHDTQRGIGRGFYSEMLIPDLRPVRSVIESYTAQATITGTDEATACGIGMSNAATGDLVVRVNGTTVYQFDRWD